MGSTSALPYFVSTGSAFSVFDKQELHPEEHAHRLTLSPPIGRVEISAIEAFEVTRSSASMEITFRVADSAKSVLADTDDPKVVSKLLEKCFGAKLESLQSVIMTKLQFARWDGTGAIHTHRENMVDLRTELADAGTKITDQTFYEHFTS